jgi:homoserine kinase
MLRTLLTVESYAYQIVPADLRPPLVFPALAQQTSATRHRIPVTRTIRQRVAASNYLACSVCQLTSRDRAVRTTRAVSRVVHFHHP